MGGRYENFGRKELESPVAEAIRRGMLDEPRKECYSCEHFWDEDDNGNRKWWCYKNNTDTSPEECCDEYKKG